MVFICYSLVFIGFHLFFTGWKHLGGIWKHLGGLWRHLGGTWETWAWEASGTHGLRRWPQQGPSGLSCFFVSHLSAICKIPLEMMFSLCVFEGNVNYDCIFTASCEIRSPSLDPSGLPHEQPDLRMCCKNGVISDVTFKNTR